MKVKEKEDMDVVQPRRMVHEWERMAGVYEGECLESYQEDEALNSCMKPRGRKFSVEAYIFIGYKNDNFEQLSSLSFSSLFSLFFPWR